MKRLRGQGETSGEGPRAPRRGNACAVALPVAQAAADWGRKTPCVRFRALGILQRGACALGGGDDSLLVFLGVWLSFVCISWCGIVSRRVRHVLFKAM